MRKVAEEDFLQMKMSLPFSFPSFIECNNVRRCLIKIDMSNDVIT